MVCGSYAASRARIGRRGVDRVAAHPGAGRVGRLPDRGGLEAAGAVAAALHRAVGRFQQDREVPAQQAAVVADQPAESALDGLDFLMVVEHEGDVPAGSAPPSNRRPRARAGPRRRPSCRWRPGRRGRPRRGRRRASGRNGAQGSLGDGQRHRVQVPGQDDAFGPAQVGAGDDRVAVADQLQLRDRRRASSTASASAVSLPDTLLMSIRAAVSRATSWRRSRRAGVSAGWAVSGSHGSDSIAAPGHAGFSARTAPSIDLGHD